MFGEHVLEQVEIPWTVNSYPYPTEPRGKSDSLKSAHDSISNLQPRFLDALLPVFI